MAGPPTGRVVFFGVSEHSGHFNPTRGLVRILTAKGLEVHYFATAAGRSAIESDGGIYHDYGSPDWDYYKVALQYTQDVLGLEGSDNMKGGSLFEVALPNAVAILPHVLSELRKIKPDFCVSDSSYPWGFLAARLLAIPIVSSCSSCPISAQQKEILFGALREVPSNKKCCEFLQDLYGIAYDAADIYCNYTDFTIIWSVPEYIPFFIDDPTVQYFGVSMPNSASQRLCIGKEEGTGNHEAQVHEVEGEAQELEHEAEIHEAVQQGTGEDEAVQQRTSEHEAVQQGAGKHEAVVPDSLLKDDELKVLLAAKANGATIVYVSMGTVMGFELWTPDVRPLFSQLFNALEHRPNTKVLLSIGNRLSVADLGPIPANFLVRASFPQAHILQHVATVFITHCGMNSTNEAMFAACPMVCMPVFGDQNMNGQRIQELGCGVLIPSPAAPAPCTDLLHMTAEAISGALESVMQSYEVYKQACLGFQSILKARLRYLHFEAADDILAWVSEQRQSARAE